MLSQSQDATYDLAHYRFTVRRLFELIQAVNIPVVFIFSPLSLERKVTLMSLPLFLALCQPARLAAPQCPSQTITTLLQVTGEVTPFKVTLKSQF
jgi:hypothetical protein